MSDTKSTVIVPSAEAILAAAETGLSTGLAAIDNNGAQS